MAYIDNDNGTVSTSNNTTATLGASATFTGTAEDVSQYPAVVVASLSDVSGTLYMEFSPDGTNWDSSLSYECDAGINEVHRLSVTRQYFRVRYVNGSSAQSYFRLQTIFGHQEPLTYPLNQQVQKDADSLIVRLIDFNLLIANNKYQNHRSILKDGINNDIDTGSVPEDIWAVGGLYTGFVTSTETLTAVSTSASDTGTLYFTYLETSSSRDYVLGSLTLNGTTPVTTAFNVWRCNFAYYDDGSAFNIGAISLYQTTTTANIFCTIIAGYGQSFCSAYTTPAGATAYIDRITSSIKGGTTAALDCFFYYRKLGTSPRYRLSFTVNTGALYFDDVDYLIAIPEQTDIVPRVLASTANNVSIELSYRLVQLTT